MSNVSTSAKVPGYTKWVTIWMRPDTYRAIRVMAAQRDTTIQGLIDDLVRREAAGPSVKTSPVN